MAYWSGQLARFVRSGSAMMAVALLWMTTRQALLRGVAYWSGQTSRVGCSGSQR